MVFSTVGSYPVEIVEYFIDRGQEGVSEFRVESGIGGSWRPGEGDDTRVMFGWAQEEAGPGRDFPPVQPSGWVHGLGGVTQVAKGRADH